MFHLLKRKHAKDLVPTLVNDKEVIMTFREDNLAYVYDFYADIFDSAPTLNKAKIDARAKIAMLKNKTLSDYMIKVLDAPLTLDDIKESINMLANGKIPRA